MEFLTRGDEFQPTVDRLANKPLSEVIAEQKYWTDMAHGRFAEAPRGKGPGDIGSGRVVIGGGAKKAGRTVGFEVGS